MVGRKFKIITPAGTERDVELSPAAIRHSPELARELMGEVVYQENLQQLKDGLEEAVKAKEKIVLSKRAEKNLAALEEKSRLRRLVGGLSREEDLQIANGDYRIIVEHDLLPPEEEEIVKDV